MTKDEVRFYYVEEVDDETPSVAEINSPNEKADNKDDSSLLTIIHKKNKTIGKLQKQIHCQSVQLKFYMKKTLDSPTLYDLSEKCDPGVIEENLPVNLAMVHFRKQKGLRSNIYTLCEHMKNVDDRMCALLNIQDCFLRRSIGKFCDSLKKNKESDFFLSRMTNSSCPIDTMNNLLNINIGLKKNLELYRLCCNRLIVIENERNDIVEEIFAMPIEERTNFNYLLGIQSEKATLKRKLKEILDDQSKLRVKIDQLNLIEVQLRQLQLDYKNAFDSSTEHVTNLLHKINKEVRRMVIASAKQRGKYRKAIATLKKDNSHLSSVLVRLRSAIEAKMRNGQSPSLEDFYAAGFYDTIERQISETVETRDNITPTNKSSTITVAHDLAQELAEMQNRNNNLSNELKTLKEDYRNYQKIKEEELDILRKENDTYIDQIEELQIIRAEHIEHLSKDEERNEEIADYKKTIEDLDNENQELRKKLSFAEKKIFDLKTINMKISALMSQIEQDHKIFIKSSAVDITEIPIEDTEGAQEISQH